MSAPWYANHANLARLVRWFSLYDLEVDLLEVLDKPWHWTPEWERCERWLPPDEECFECDGDGRVEESTRPDSAHLVTCDACDGTGRDAGRCRECRTRTKADTLTSNRGLCWQCQPHESPAVAKADYQADLAKDERGVA